jgi:hypothetical protein
VRASEREWRRAVTRKVGGAWLATGYWGRDPNCRIRQEQTPEKIKALLQDKLIAMGRPVELWLPVDSDDEALPACTCDKNTRPGADFRCLSCYGVRRIPGYRRFLHETVFFSSAEYTSYTLTDVVRDTSIKPNRLRLAPSAVTGTIVTGDKAYSNARSEDWTSEVAAFRKTDTDTILVEFSTDAGASWTNLTAINGGAKPIGSGNVRFRITLTRAAITTDSPDFEILRIQHRQPDRMTEQSKARRDLLAGQVLILRTWVTELTMRQLALARQTEFTGDKSWTAPLDFYDTLIVRDTPAAKIDDRDAGPHPFYAHAFGIELGERFPIYQISYNEQLLTFTHQAFFERRSQKGELYYLVF